MTNLSFRITLAVSTVLVWRVPLKVCPGPVCGGQMAKCSAVLT